MTSQGAAAVLTETILVPEIHCDHCRTSLEGALKPIEGVEQAAVDVAARTVTVTYDQTLVDRARLVETIEEQGYEVPAEQGSSGI
jgi:copper chaperone